MFLVTTCMKTAITCNGVFIYFVLFSVHSFSECWFEILSKHCLWSDMYYINTIFKEERVLAFSSKNNSSFFTGFMVHKSMIYSLLQYNWMLVFLIMNWFQSLPNLWSVSHLFHQIISMNLSYWIKNSNSSLRLLCFEKRNLNEPKICYRNLNIRKIIDLKFNR